MEIDEITLARRTIALLSSMVEGGEVHTSRSKEMVTNSLKALEQVKNNDSLHSVSQQRELLKAFLQYVNCSDTESKVSFDLLDKYLNSL